MMYSRISVSDVLTREVLPPWPTHLLTRWHRTSLSVTVIKSYVCGVCVRITVTHPSSSPPHHTLFFHYHIFPYTCPSKCTLTPFSHDLLIHLTVWHVMESDRLVTIQVPCLFTTPSLGPPISLCTRPSGSLTDTLPTPSQYVPVLVFYRPWEPRSPYLGSTWPSWYHSGGTNPFISWNHLRTCSLTYMLRSRKTDRVDRSEIY